MDNVTLIRIVAGILAVVVLVILDCQDEEKSSALGCFLPFVFSALEVFAGIKRENVVVSVRR